MKTPVQLCFVVAPVVLFVAIAVGVGFRGQKSITVEIPIPRTAVDLELTPGDNNKVVRWVLWSDGSITSSVGTRSYWAIPQPDDCPEDVDGDGVVSIADIIAVQQALGKKWP